jgi:hypothetical protein
MADIQAPEDYKTWRSGSVVAQLVRQATQHKDLMEKDTGLLGVYYAALLCNFGNGFASIRSVYRISSLELHAVSHALLT